MAEKTLSRPAMDMIQIALEAGDWGEDDAREFADNPELVRQTLEKVRERRKLLAALAPSPGDSDWDEFEYRHAL